MTTDSESTLKQGCHPFGRVGSAGTAPWERALGAIPMGDGRAGFRVWAPGAESLALRLRGEDRELAGEGYGVHSVEAEAAAGDDYVFVVDGAVFPDPCSRWQPDGLRGPSRVVDAGAFEWTDADWRGVAL